MKLKLVPPGQGARWTIEGIRIFFKQPLALSGLFMLYSMLNMACGYIPLIGLVIYFMITPASNLGLMAATREAQQGRFPKPTMLWVALTTDKQRLRSMLLLGIIYSAVCTLLFVLFNSLYSSELKALAKVSGLQINPQAWEQSGLLGPFLGVALVYLPISMLFWHAPALVYWHGVTPIKSLFFSAVALVKNLGAFAVYSLTWLCIILLFVMLLNMLALVTGWTSLGLIFIPAIFVLTVMMTASLYPTFRDCFFE